MESDLQAPVVKMRFDFHQKKVYLPSKLNIATDSQNAVRSSALEWEIPRPENYEHYETTIINFRLGKTQQQPFVSFQIRQFEYFWTNLFNKTPTCNKSPVFLTPLVQDISRWDISRWVLTFSIEPPQSLIKTHCKVTEKWGLHEGR